MSARMPTGSRAPVLHLLIGLSIASISRGRLCSRYRPTIVTFVSWQVNNRQNDIGDQATGSSRSHYGLCEWSFQVTLWSVDIIEDAHGDRPILHRVIDDLPTDVNLKRLPLNRVLALDEKLEPPEQLDPVKVSLDDV